mmetsp:Transcript_45041/g.90895  ORF Transcript_45041/g.90895 Transcript_45041/m.90895 type:complete len:302 (+) Transcript_45041:447-1352(+)
MLSNWLKTKSVLFDATELFLLLPLLPSSRRTKPSFLSGCGTGGTVASAPSLFSAASSCASSSRSLSKSGFTPCSSANNPIAPSRSNSELGAVEIVDADVPTATVPCECEPLQYSSSGLSMVLANRRGPRVLSKVCPTSDMQRMYTLAAVSMYVSATFSFEAPRKKRSVIGRLPRAACIIARGSVPRKQKQASCTVVQRGCVSQPRALRVVKTDTNTPTNRADNPTPINGKMPMISGTMLRLVPLPIMLNRINCPNTHTPPRMPFTSERTSRSAAMAKVVPIATTNNSEINIEPGANPNGTK